MRFQGFSDDWEQRELGELATKIGSGKTPRGGSSVYTQSGIPLLRSQNIYDDKVSFEDVAFINDSTDEDMANSRVNRGDVLLNITGASIGRSAVYELSATANVNQHVCIIRPSSNVHSYFIQLNLASSEGQKQIELNQAGGGREGLNFQQIAKMSFYYPSLEEQIKLGVFFQQLNKTIALHQRMSDKQKKLKANLLQMMFPRNGEKIPEVRLAGFAEDWAQRTLEDISDKVTEKNKAREFTETLTNSAEYGIISQSDFFDKDISNINNIDGYYVVRPDDFVYNPRISNFAPVGPIKRNNLNRIGIMSPLYYVFRPKGVDHTFLEKYFETSYWHIFMKMNGDSGARADRFAIKDAILKEMPIPYPVKEEQVRIGIFFNQLDKSIALHQEKIAHLKTLKNTLLNKMFI
ncbi:MAG: restriction endonuclease subunit S [Bacilli bacterium]|nr:restriction endonuclease subunit S [Bacilli bacterium]